MLNFFSDILNLNHSVLSGVMDIVVIHYPDGTLKSSPFHLRFGTLKILKTNEKIITITVNGIKSDLTMRLSSSGDGYFLQESGSNDELEMEMEDLSNSSNYAERKNSAPDSPNYMNFKNQNLDENMVLKNLANKTCIERDLKSVFKENETLQNDNLNSVRDSSKNSSPKPVSKQKGVFRRMYNFVTRNKSVDNNKLNDNQIKETNINNEDQNIKKIDIQNLNKEIDSTTVDNLSYKINSPTANDDKNEYNSEKQSFENERKVSNNESIGNESLNHNNLKLFQIIEISNCWNLITDNTENLEEIFYKNIVSKEEFYKDPWKILNNKNLMIRYEDKLYTSKAAFPILISMLAYGEFPPENVMKNLLLSKEGGFFSFFKSKKVNLLKFDLKKSKSIKSPTKVEDEGFHIIDEKKIIEERKSENETKVNIGSNLNLKKPSILYKKTLVPSDSQLKKLNLKPGRNEIKFTVSSKFQGTHSLITDLYLWESDTKIVISDVDGTITRSDVLGQLMPIFGKDWSHNGVTELFNNIKKNNYNILYLTARPIAQSKQTKNYLTYLNQKGICLPRGPVLMSPDGVVSSFKREVIDKQPQKFKIACLIEIMNLFPVDYRPFYAGFGNRETDTVSYRSVNIDMGKIFIINEKGEISQINHGYKKNYLLLNETVDEIFPDRKGNNFSDEPDYWKEKMSFVELKDLDID